jgi:hypothetical protein
MIEGAAAREERRVRIDTVDGAVEGSLRISPGLRTLDDLNLVAKRFVTIYSPKSLNENWQTGQGSLSVNKDSILFVRELSSPPPRAGGNFGSFTRAPIRLHVKQFEVEGFVHVPPGGSPMKRLDQSSHPFVSLTSVLVTSTDSESTAPFLAVNRNRVTAAQVVDHDQEAAALSSVDKRIER